jgi:type I restriction enzyme, S subunit
MSEQNLDTWKSVKVGDLVEKHFCGPSPDCEERQVFESNEWGVLKTTAITWSGWDEKAHKVLPKGYWNRPDIEVQAGDVLVTKAGPRHRVGVVCHVPTTRKQLVVSGKIIGLRPKVTVVSPTVLAGLISQEEAQKYIQDRTTGMAESQVNFANEVLLTTPLKIPPLREQATIVKVLGSLDAAIYHTKAIISKLKTIKRGLLDDLLMRGADEQSQVRPLLSEAPHLYKETLLGPLPNEWDCQRLENLSLKIVDGVHKTPKYLTRGIPFVTIKNLTASRDIDFGSLNYISEKDHSEFVKRADPRSGDVLVTKDGTLGIARMVKDNHPEFSIFVSVAQIRVDSSKLIPQFLLAFFESSHYHSQIGVQSGGSGLKHIHLEQFRDFKIPVPSLGEQTLICEILNANSNRIDLEEEQLYSLLKIKAGLSRDLLAGRVPVGKLTLDKRR